MHEGRLGSSAGVADPVGDSRFLDTYLQHSKPVLWRDPPNEPIALRADVETCLVYMFRVEENTACYLRDALVTRAHHDPAVTNFLVAWAFEESHHALAIQRLLALGGVDVGGSTTHSERRSRRRREWVSHLAITAAAGVRLDLFPLHMTVGYLNEITARLGYRRLAAVVGDDSAAELLLRIANQESRHAHFYEQQARLELASSPAQQRFVRFVLRAGWSPVGSGISSRPLQRQVARFLFGAGAASEVAAIDAAVSQLPGLADVQPLTTALRRLGGLDQPFS
jgi:hypothetical protein